MGKLKATVKALGGIADKVSDLVRLGYPESTARKIASGELPMDSASRMERAREQGFDVDTTLYHGTKAGDIGGFDLGRTGSTNSSARGIAAFTSDSPKTAETYSGGAGDSSAIYPLLARRGDSAEYDFGGNRWNDYPLDGSDTNMLAHDAMDEGYDSAVFRDVQDHGGDIPHHLLLAKLDELNGTGLSALDPSSEEYWEAAKGFGIDDWSSAADAVRAEMFGPANNTAIFDPSNIRSTNAAFDPDQKDSSNLLAGLGAAGVGLGLAGQSEDADAASGETVESTDMLAATAAAANFAHARSQKQGQWDSLRADLMNTLQKVNTGAAFAMDALEVPWKGLLGASRVAGGLAAGESFGQAMNQGANQVRNPLEQTAYDLGGVAADATGSPVVGAAVNAGIQVGGPI